MHSALDASTDVALSGVTASTTLLHAISLADMSSTLGHLHDMLCYNHMHAHTVPGRYMWVAATREGGSSTYIGVYSTSVHDACCVL